MSIWTDLMGVPFSQGYVDAGGIKTRVVEAGTGPVLVFLHGTGGHAEAYVRNIAAHAKHFHVYAIDMIGHGYSDYPDIDYGVDTFVEHVSDFIDAVGGRVHLSGESLGAMVASRVAMKYPHKIDRLVLNTGLPIVPSEAGRQELLQGLEISRKAAGALTREIVRTRLGFLMHEPEKMVTEELIDVRFNIYNRPGMLPIMGRIAQAVLGTITDLDSANGIFEPSQLKQIKSPTLILWTRYNPGQHMDVAEKGMELIPNAQLHVMENSAHWPQWEEVEEFDRAHIGFLLAKG